MNPILTSDTNAAEKIRQRIADLERLQEHMKAANVAIRSNKAKGAAAQVAALVALGISEADAIQLLRPDFCGRVGFANYELSNNNANIRRLRERLETVSIAQATPETSRESGGITLEDCPADNRVRLFFPGKPDSSVRDRLKRSGFRWTPSLGCWQAYRNPSALGVATSFVPATVAVEIAEDRAALTQLQAAA